MSRQRAQKSNSRGLFLAVPPVPTIADDLQSCYQAALGPLPTVAANATQNHRSLRSVGLDPNATEADVRAAYLRLVKRHHPDKNRGDKASEWIFKEVQSAYEILRDAKGVRPVGQQGPPPSPGDQAERDQRDGAEHDRRQQQHSERPEREKHRRWRQQQSQAAREDSPHAPTGHTTRKRSDAESTFRRTLRWGKWTVYCSNAFLWPSALAGLLEWLPDRVGVLVFGWMALGAWMLVWDFVLKGSIKAAVEQFRR